MGSKSGSKGHYLQLTIIYFYDKYLALRKMSLSTNECLHIATFIAFLMSHPWKIVFLPPYWVQKKWIYTRNGTEDNLYACDIFHSTLELPIRPSIYIYSHVLSVSAVKLLKMVFWPPCWAQKEEYGLNFRLKITLPSPWNVSYSM